MVEFLSLAFLKKLLANFSKTTKITYLCLLQRKKKRKVKTKNNFSNLIQNLSQDEYPLCYGKYFKITI